MTNKCIDEIREALDTDKTTSEELFNESRDKAIKYQKEYNSFVKVGAYFGVTDNAVRKWCKLYKLPIHSRELHKVLESIEIK